MPQITQIKPQRNKKRVNIYLDNKFGFGLDLENFMKLRLKVGQELSEKEIGEILKKAEFQNTSDKLLNFATLRPRSEKEINDWFRRKKIHESMRKGLFDRLNRLELLGDEKFAKWWVGQRIQFKHKSKKELQYELRAKGIEKDIISQVLLETDIDEKKTASDLLSKKMYKWNKFEGQEKSKKMSEFLGRKGFSWDIIKKVVAEIDDFKD